MSGFEKVILCLSALLAGYAPAQAQTSNFRHYTVAHGLGGSAINHIFQDSRGYIWFAAQGGGASRFNGKEFKNFTRADGLCNNDVTYITEDRKGNIWIGSAGGASKFNGVAFQNYDQSAGLTDGVVYSIYAGADEKIWFATKDGGVRIFDGTNFDSLTAEIHGLPDNEVYCIIQDNSGAYWFGTSYGIAKYHDGKVTSYRDSALVNDHPFFSVFKDSAGTLWFGSVGYGVLTVHPDNSMQGFELPAEVQRDFIGGITQDTKGNMWFATEHGLLKYDGTRFKLFGEREGLSLNTTQTVLCDYEGNIWTGTLGGGVNLLSSEAFMLYTEKNGLLSKNVTCVLPLPGGEAFYAGTGDGLYLFTPAEEIPFTKIRSDGIENISISSMSIGSDGLLWICAQEGIFVLEAQKTGFALRRKYKSIDGVRLISPLKVIHDTAGNCWIATYGSGLFFISGDQEKAYHTGNGFPSDNVLTLYADKRGGIWIGTYDAGLIKYDGKTFLPVTIADASIDKAVWSVAEDNAGNIYWGSGESGAYRYNGKGIVNYSLKNGLSSDYVPALAWDDHESCLWLGSEKSLDKVKFNAEGGVDAVTSFKDESKVHSAGINHDAIRVNGQGPIWMGTVNGLWLYDRYLDFPKNVAPKIELTGIRLFYQAADWKGFGARVDERTRLPLNLHLPYHKNHLTFDVQAFTTQDVRYVFQLEGQDDAWSVPTKGNEITYSNINPGADYVFRVKAINARNVESPVASFAFTIDPPWWQTWWFRTSAFILVAGGLIGFIKTREKILKDRNRMLEATVEQRTLEIKLQKNKIEQTLSEKETLLQEKEVLLKEIHHRVKNNLQTISSMLMLQSAALKDDQAKKIIAESQSRVHSIALVHQKLYQHDGLEMVELHSFVQDLMQQVRSLYKNQNQHITLNVLIPETYVLIDTAIPLGLILNELLTNSFKYAFTGKSVGEINVELIRTKNVDDQEKHANAVQLIYRDNGPGIKSFTEIEHATTLGLQLIKLLSQQIGARLQYSNAKGSEFIFTFDLTQHEEFEDRDRGR